MNRLYPSIILLLIGIGFSGCSYSSSSHIITQSVGYLDEKGDFHASLNVDMSRSDLGINMNANYAINNNTGLNVGACIYGSELHPVNFETNNGDGSYIYSSEDFELKGTAIQTSLYRFNKIGRLGYIQYGAGIMKSFNEYIDKFSLREYTLYRYQPWSGLGNVSIGLKSKVISASVGMKMMYTWFGSEVPVMTKLDYSFRRKEDQLFSMQPYYDLRLGVGPLKGMLQSGFEFYPFKGYGAGKFNLYYALGLQYTFELKRVNGPKIPKEIQL